MAASSESDGELMATVADINSKLVNNVSGDHSKSFNGSDGDGMQNQTAVVGDDEDLKQQIIDMEQEILLLEEKLQEKESTTVLPPEIIQHCMDHLYHHKTEEKEDTDEDEPEDLEAELKLLSTVTGLDIAKCSHNITGLSDNKLRKDYYLEASTFSCNIALHFIVVQYQGGPRSGQALVTQLRCEVDAEVPDNIQEACTRAEEALSIPTLIRIIVSYNRWRKLRHDTFSRLAHEFPLFVHLSKDRHDVLQFYTKHKHSPRYTIHWDTLVGKDSTVVPLVQLLIQVDSRVLKNEEHHKLLDEAPNKFLEMVKEMGEFAAIEAMLKSVCLK